MGERISDLWPKWMWALLAVVAFTDAVWIAVTPLSLSAGSYPLLALMLPFAALLGLIVLRQDTFANWPRLTAVLVGWCTLLIAWPTLRLFNHVTMTTAFPWADEWLSAADQLLGFDWVTYVRWSDRNPWWLATMSAAYGGLRNYSIFLYMLLCIGPRPIEACAEFLKLFVLSAVTCTAAGMFFPAVAASVLYAKDIGPLEHMRPYNGAYHLTAIVGLREDPARVLNLGTLQGLVTFPSFHTALGIIAIYCARRVPLLFAASVAVNLTMIAATPVYGAHYLIDVIAGAIAAAALIYGLRLYERQREGAPQVAIGHGVG